MIVCRKKVGKKAGGDQQHDMHGRMKKKDDNSILRTNKTQQMLMMLHSTLAYGISSSEGTDLPNTEGLSLPDITTIS